MAQSPPLIKADSSDERYLQAHKLLHSRFCHLALCFGEVNLVCLVIIIKDRTQDFFSQRAETRDLLSNHRPQSQTNG